MKNKNYDSARSTSIFRQEPINNACEMHNRSEVLSQLWFPPKKYQRRHKIPI